MENALQIEQSELVFEKGYSWEAEYVGDDSRITGEPDKTLLNRQEGYEVLYFVNKYLKKKGLKRKDSAERIEKMIKDCPGHLRSQENVYNWIAENWLTWKENK